MLNGKVNQLCTKTKREKQKARTEILTHADPVTMNISSFAKHALLGAFQTAGLTEPLLPFLTPVSYYLLKK